VRVIAVAAAALAASAGVAGVAFPRPAQPRLIHPQVCTGDEFDEEVGLCTKDDRGTVVKTYDVVCSVDVHVERRTRLAIRLLYAGRVQRSVSLVVTPGANGPKSLRLRFPDLDLPRTTPENWNLPRGGYACDFRLGSLHVVVPFRSGGAAEAVLAPHWCLPLGGGTPIEFVCGAATPSHSLACSAVFARLAGHRLGVQILRGQGNAATLLYEGSDVATVPIAAEWAYTSAPDGGFMPLGQYECRFLVDGRVAVRTPFEIKD
jgi:hypothetical protein